MRFERVVVRLIVMCLSISLCLTAGAQVRSAGGVVTNAKTGEALEYIAVYFKNTTDGCITNNKGEFYLRNTTGADSLVIEAIGYKKFIYLMKKAKEDNLAFAIEPESIRLNEAVVKPRREKYQNKGNPAVEFIKNVIKNSDRHRIESQDYYSSDVYEKLTLSLDDISADMLEKDKYRFLSNYVDTSEVTGNPVLTLSIRENTGKYYYRRQPATEKFVRTAQRIEGIDEDLDNHGTLTANLEQVLTGVDIFDNEISFLVNRFVSPLSKAMALSYYKYYIMDTVQVKGSPCVDIAFVPRNPESFGFTGRLYVSADSSYSIRKVQLNFPAKSNVNWITKLQIDQEFEQTEDGLWALSREDSYVNFAVIDEWQGIFAHHTRCFDNYEVNPILASRTDIYDVDEYIIMSEALKEVRDPGFWDDNRLVPLSKREQEVSEAKSELEAKTHISTWTHLADAFVSEWVPARYPKDKSYFNFGPILSLAGFNYIEKFRVKIGGMTTANLSKQWFFNGYLAYGTGDKKLKGQVEIIHSFVPKVYHSQESLKNNLSASFSYDIFSPESIGVQHDLTTSLKANSVKTYQYIRRAEIKYERQWTNGLTNEFTAANIQMTPATTADPASLSYQYLNPDGQLVNVPHITTTEFGVSIRWAPGERQTNALSKRRKIDKDTPIITLQHRIGVPELLGGDYFYNRTDFSFYKRFRMSFAGFLDAKVVACKVWNEVPWPLLSHPAVNSSFAYRQDSFNTMTPLEFIMDQYVQWSLTWHMKGMIFNRIPLVKRLNLRELVIFNGLWGSLTDKNNPAKNLSQFILPYSSVPIGNTPFMEVGGGIENIFRCFRLVYFHRINYGKNNDRTLGTLSGFRVGLYVDF